MSDEGLVTAEVKALVGVDGEPWTAPEPVDKSVVSPSAPLRTGLSNHTPTPFDRLRANGI